MSLRIAVTGAGGFLGTELLRQLAAEGRHEVIAFTFDFERSRETFVRAANIAAVDNSEAAQFDYSGVDVLINCAFPRNVSDESFAQGLDFVRDVLAKAAADRVGAVINISSQSVYSQKRQDAASEQTPAVLESKYAVGKYWSELFVNTLFQGMRHTNLRMASLIGAGFDQRITNKFAKCITEGRQITLTGGEQRFGFLDVRDAASGILTVAADAGDWDEVYNLGGAQQYTLLEIAHAAHEIGAEYGFSAPAPVAEAGGEWQNSTLDCTRLCARFHWQPQFSLEDTLRAVYDNLKGRA